MGHEKSQIHYRFPYHREIREKIEKSKNVREWKPFIIFNSYSNNLIWRISCFAD